ncbi:RNA ligase [Paracoccus litorisediminis]|uniref:RNA ligase n=1 Tax=Paracoccus litorisediminis TaxID=2006130 RepID=UPI00372EE8EA
MSKKVIFIRGPQGAGKTTLVRRAGLEGFNLSLDKIRNIVAGDTLAQNGQFIPNHDHGPLIWKIFTDSIDRRIAGGEVVCIDGTLANGNELYDIWKKFDQAGYSGLIVDLYGFDDRLRLERNAARAERERVPEVSVRRMKEISETSPMPPIMLQSESISVLRVVDDASAARALGHMARFLKDPRTERDLSAYREIVHIGDLQGTFSPLVDPASPVKNGLEEDVFYVFLGDLFDRGKENGEVAEWFIRNALGKPNVTFVAGNHEDYVDKQSLAKDDDIDLPNSEWVRLSWPQIKAAGVDWRQIRKISKFSQDYLAYTWRDKRVLCSHAGFGRWPSNMDLVSQHQMRRGNGHFAVDVDAEWSAAETDTGRYQIHGHRNERMLPTLASPLSFNLEGQVEFGGHMRMLRLDATGFSNIDIRPRVFRTMQEDVALNKEVDRMSMSKFPPILPWAEVGGAPAAMRSETVRTFADHRMIMLKDMANLPGIQSVNFTREAFYDAHWDEFTTLARGLFIDGEDNTIVARSYPKFFNHGERPETSGEVLLGALKYPVTAFEKLNGFLCITGYSERLRTTIIASKSRTDGDFADMAGDVLRQTLGEAAVERIGRLNRDQLCSLVFEIEEPVRDPHIIKLDAPRAVLLACIRRSEHFEQASYKDLEKIAKWVGCEVKAPIAVLPNDKALAAFHRRVEQDPNWKFNGRHIEGAVIEDGNGFHYKLKAGYYRNWKFMRSAVNVIANAKEAGQEPRLERFAAAPAEFQAFLGWAKTLSVTALRHDIISLRDAYEGDRAVMETIVDAAPVVPVDRSEEKFRAVIAQVDGNEKLSSESLGRFLTMALADPKKATMLREYENFDAMMARAGMEIETEPTTPGF